MKANIHHILEAYKALDSLSTEELEVSDIIAILGVKRVLRPIKEEYDAFVKDATHSLRPADFDKLVEIEQRIDSASDEEKAYHQEGVEKYNKALVEAINTEYAEAIEFEAKMPEETIAKIAKMKKWTIAEMGLLSILM